MKILTLTMNPTIDVSSRVGQVIPEKKLRCDAPRYEPGGGGVNVSRAIKKLDGESFALYLAGGANGQLLQDLLDKEEIENHPFSIQADTRQNIIIREKSSDQQFRFGMPGPDVQEDEWKRCLDELRDLLPDYEYLVASGSLPRGVPQDFYARVAKIGRQTDTRVIVDTKGDQLAPAVEQGLFMIKPNMRELESIAGQSIETDAEMEKVAHDILERKKCRAIVVSLGAGGALALFDDEHKNVRSPTVPIKSKVGAGDSMVAGIVFSLSWGKSMLQSVKYGVAAGAAAVMTPGTELCQKKDVERLFEKLQE